MSHIEIDNDSELLYSAIFKQIQECGDIISSILIISKFISENNILTEFNAEKLRGIALRSLDKETSTFLWHINALIAASSDFEHLLLGIEIMFDRFLGNKHLFIKEKEKQKLKQKSIISTPNQSKPLTKPTKNKFIGNEIISFVNSHYDHNENYNQNIKEYKDENNHNHHENDNDFNEINDKIQNIDLSNQTKWSHPQNAQNAQNAQNDENEDYMNKYRGKISSPISFRMRQQKRMKQSERTSNSRNSSRNTSIDLDFARFKQQQQYKMDNNIDDIHDGSINISSSFKPEILSPFNVSKFAKTVDTLTSDINPTPFNMKTV